MGRLMRVLAILVLLATIGGAGVVLYGLNTMQPQIEQVIVTKTPAVQAQTTFDMLMEQAALGTFTGTAYRDTAGLRAQDCTFMTYAVRLKNSGFFPAEWIHLKVEPKEGDVLQLGDAGAYVLGAGARGDLTATILHEGDSADAQRTLKVTCYVFGQRIEFFVTQTAAVQQN